MTNSDWSYSAAQAKFYNDLLPFLEKQQERYVAGEYDDEILIGLVADPDEEPADASSSLLIMALGAEKGTEVEVSSDNAEAVEKIAGLIEQDLDAS